MLKKNKKFIFFLLVVLIVEGMYSSKVKAITVQRSNNIKEIVESFKENLGNNSSLTEDAKKLVDEFIDMENSRKNIIENCESDLLLQELDLSLQSIEQLSIAGQGVIKAITSIKDGDLEKWWINYSSAKKALVKMDEINKDNDTVETDNDINSRNEITSFVKEMLKTSENLYYDTVGIKEINVEKILTQAGNQDDRTDINEAVTNSIYTNIKALKNIEIIKNEDNSIAYPEINSVIMRRNDCIGFKLGGTLKIDEIKLELDSKVKELENLSVEHSDNGIEWKKVEAVVEENTIKTVEKVIAKYIRVINKNEKVVEGNITKFIIIPEQAVTQQLISNAKGYKGNVRGTLIGNLSSISDGNIDTVYESEREPIEGDYISYSMNDIDNKLSNIYILQDKDSISNAIVKIKTTKYHWITVGKLDKPFNNIDLSLLDSNKVSEIKIEWNNKGSKPIINEITPVYVEVNSKDIDKTVLKENIDLANKLFMSAEEGDEVGEYKVGSKKDLDILLMEAESIYDSNAATKEEVEDIEARLILAIEEFNSFLIR